jgi:hypothetical protein
MRKYISSVQKLFISVYLSLPRLLEHQREYIFLFVPLSVYILLDWNEDDRTSYFLYSLAVRFVCFYDDDNNDVSMYTQTHGLEK